MKKLNIILINKPRFCTRLFIQNDSGDFKIFKFSSISNIKGFPVVIFKSKISVSEIFNKYFISALKLLP